MLSASSFLDGSRQVPQGATVVRPMEACVCPAHALARHLSTGLVVEFPEYLKQTSQHPQ